MSEEHTRELMTKYFPQCPICRSKADYAVSPSKIIVQCKMCKAKFRSDEFQDPQKDLTGFSLFSLPSTSVDESLVPILSSMKDQNLPVSFWQNVKLDRAGLEQQFAGYRKESGTFAAEMPGRLFDISKESAAQRAIQYMTPKGYHLVSRSESMLVFEDGKDLNIVILILGILFLLLGAILYYLLSRKHTITVMINQTDKGTEVQCTTNTPQAMQVADRFLQSLPNI